MTRDSKLEYENACIPMDVTELGMVMEVKAWQLQKANLPIVVTELPMVTEVKLLQPSNLQLFVYQEILVKTVEK